MSNDQTNNEYYKLLDERKFLEGRVVDVENYINVSLGIIKDFEFKKINYERSNVISSNEYDEILQNIKLEKKFIIQAKQLKEEYFEKLEKLNRKIDAIKKLFGPISPRR